MASRLQDFFERAGEEIRLDKYCGTTCLEGTTAGEVNGREYAYYIMYVCVILCNILSRVLDDISSKVIGAAQLNERVDQRMSLEAKEEFSRWAKEGIAWRSQGDGSLRRQVYFAPAALFILILL